MIPLSVPNLKGNELQYISKAINEEWVSTAGSYITIFEEKMVAYVKSNGAVSTQNGTAALHLAMNVIGIKSGDEVLVPTLTFIAAVNPVKYVGAEPIFIDCDDNLTIDPIKLETFCRKECQIVEKKLIHLSTGRHVKAIVVVHVFGNMADMVTICQIAKKYHLMIVEDASEALGTYYTCGIYKGKFAGTIGDIGVYSFNGNKIITTGGGGMIVSDNMAYLKHAKHLSTQAKSDELFFEHNEIGYNYRMTNVQAAMGLAQLEQIEHFITRKKRNFERYLNFGIHLQPFRRETRSNYWFYTYLSDNRNELMNFLNQKGVQTRPVWKLIHTLKPYQDSQIYNISKASDYYNKILNIPCSSNLQDQEIEYIAEQIEQFNLS